MRYGGNILSDRGVYSVRVPHANFARIFFKAFSLYQSHVVTISMAKCRICSSVIGRSHCISLFSEDNAKDTNLASRMAKLLEVPISQEDNLSNFVNHAKGVFDFGNQAGKYAHPC